MAALSDPAQEFTAQQIVRLRALLTDCGLSPEALAMALRTSVRPLLRLSENLRDACNTDRAVAGMEGRYWVRAALDPAYATEEARDALVQRILDGDDSDDRLWFLTPENRGRVAAAVLTGWVTSRLQPSCPCGDRVYSSRCPVDRHRAYHAALGAA